MLAHLIHHEGKGGWVFGLPLLIAFILFILFENLNLDTQYIRSVTLLSSSIILYYMDYDRVTIFEGVSEKRLRTPSKKNSLVWIPMRYWAVAIAILGVISVWYDLVYE